MGINRWMNRPIVRRGLTLVHWLLALAPLLLWMGLLGMLERATRILGKIPQPSINDPYQFGQADSLYQAWIHIAGVGLWLVILSWLPWCVLTAVSILGHWRYWSKQEPQSVALWRFGPIALYLLGNVALYLDPLNLLAWFLD
ncbi:MAG: hypothetical protein EA001_01055 [Oscillatoriales cyanobacterium]|nr:MAG: hypothetical protein EA001_01055 [Oscillatoriales cyanobacterium]